MNQRHGRQPTYVAEFFIAADFPAFRTERLDAEACPDPYHPPRYLTYPFSMPFGKWFKRYQMGAFADLHNYAGGPGPSPNEFYNNATPERHWDSARGVYHDTYNYQGHRVNAMPDRRPTNSWYSDYGVDPRSGQDVRHGYIWEGDIGRWVEHPIGNQNYGTAQYYAERNGYPHGHGRDGYVHNDANWFNGNCYMPSSNHETHGSRNYARKFVDFMRRPNGTQSYYPNNHEQMRFGYTGMGGPPGRY
jgi:hypothetical protein